MRKIAKDLTRKTLFEEKQYEPAAALVYQNNRKNRWARPDSDRRPPPCEGGGIRAYYDKEGCGPVIEHLVDTSWQPYEV